jgi:hypothetical protein
LATSYRLEGLALAVIIVLSSNGLAGQLFLNVYVDDTIANKALVVGNVDDPSGLPFLNTSDQIHRDNGQLYAVCDSLLKRDGQSWMLEFPARGYYDEYHAVFYIPGGFEFQEINCTQGLEFFSTTYNGSLVLDVQGYELFDPAVYVSYGMA